MSDPKELRHAALFDLSDDGDQPPAPAPKRKAKAKSPTSRTLDYCRKQGWDAAVVERWNPHARVRHDLFGVIDILAMDGLVRGVLAIQATTGSNLGARVEKVSEEPRARLWLVVGGRLECWGWRKVGKRGEQKKWAVRRLKAELVGGVIEWDEVGE